MVKLQMCLLGVVLAAAGCGSSSAGSCSTPSTGSVTQCIDYGDGYTSAQVMQSCTANHSTYSTSPCPSDARVARCVLSVSAAGVTAVSTLNYYPPNTAANVMQACSASATAGVMATFEAN